MFWSCWRCFSIVYTYHPPLLSLRDFEAELMDPSTLGMLCMLRLNRGYMVEENCPRRCWWWKGREQGASKTSRWSYSMEKRIYKKARTMTICFSSRALQRYGVEYFNAYSNTLIIYYFYGPMYCLRRRCSIAIYFLFQRCTLRINASCEERLDSSVIHWRTW